MPERFPPLQFDNDSGQELESELTKHFGSNPNFKWKDDKGAPIGPFAVLAYTPDLLHPLMVLGDAVLNHQDVGPRNREIACLAVLAVFDVPFMQYAHERIGVKVGLSPEQISSAIKGVTAEGLTETEVVIYETALNLARARGDLDKESWLEAESKLGKEGVARLGHVVAWFIYNCILLNLGAVDVPSGQIELIILRDGILKDRSCRPGSTLFRSCLQFQCNKLSKWRKR